MRELYSLSFTPNKPINKTEYYDSVSDIIINGETLEDRDKRIVQEYIDEVVKKLSSYMEYYGDMGKCDKFEAYVNALRIIKGE